MGFLKTIPGIGNQISLMFILSTNNFKLFESAKQMACYAGYSIPQSIRVVIAKKDRVSRHANKSLESIITPGGYGCCKVTG
ncbi:MAG: transposase [Flavobacteriales bacterium]